MTVLLPGKLLRRLLAVCALCFSLASALAQTTAFCATSLLEYDPYGQALGSSYIPMDSWIYPAVDRLHALGQADAAYAGIRPWSRLSILHMLQRGADKINATTAESEACRIYLTVEKELKADLKRRNDPARLSAKIDSVYARALGISGMPLRDSYHLGQTIVNDYGRPYQQGFNNASGLSARVEKGRLAFYIRGEFQYAPAGPGYSPSLAALLSENDGVPFAAGVRQSTIPLGPIASVGNARLLEANLSWLTLNHEISFGKNDHWLGPAQGGSFAWSNNADNIYGFQIDRVEPLRIPLLSHLTGPFRYQFFVGSLQGHSDPNAPWIHSEKVSFKPTANLELGFSRSVIWGGRGHVPITIGSFLKSFFSFQDVPAPEKVSRNDPGARFGTFDFSYRLPYLRDWLTLYADSLAHDDVSPISAPRRAGIRPGLYLSRFPRYHALDFRVEAADTDPPTSRSNNGQFLYWEQIQKQGYTNKGFIVGDWIGRESKGGQAWLTYHLSPQEQVQFSYRNAKAAKDFIPGGTTQNDFQLSATKRIGRHYELQGFLQREEWKAPAFQPSGHAVILGSARVAWYP